MTEPIEDRVLKLEERQTRFGEDIHRLSTTVSSIEEKVGKFNDKLAARPSWAVCTIIAFLAATSTALGSTLLTMLVQSGG